MHITDKTSKDIYPMGDHTVFKQEYWDNPTRKRQKINLTENTTNKSIKSDFTKCWFCNGKVGDINNLKNLDPEYIFSNILLNSC